MEDVKGEKMLDDIIQEEADNFTEQQDTIAADSVKHVVFERIKAVLQSERQIYTERELIRAFVQGAAWASIYPLEDYEFAEAKARFMMERGWLGSEKETP